MATVQIIDRATGEPVETIDATNLRDATQIASAVRINLDHVHFYAWIQD